MRHSFWEMAKAPLALFFIPLGCMLIILFSWDAWHTRYLATNWNNTLGTVTDVHAASFGNSYNVSYIYRIDGEEYTGTAKGQESISAGTQVLIWYDPAEPYKSETKLKPYAASGGND